MSMEGLVWSLRPNDIDVQLLTASRQLMQNLETETGLHPGWINNGGLFIASTKERLEEYKRLRTASTSLYVLTYLLHLDGLSRQHGCRDMGPRRFWGRASTLTFGVT